MYHTHWGLQFSPFGNPAAVAGTTHPGCDEALARLQYLAEQRGRLGLLLGAPGTGKTMLLRRFCDLSRRQGLAVSLIGGRGCDERSLVHQLIRDWHVTVLGTPDVADLWNLLADRLVELRYEQTACLVALDDAHLASTAVKQQVERLAHLAGSAQTQLTLLLASTPEDAGRLGQEWLDQIELRIDLTPWTEEETAHHIAQCLLSSGSTQPIFTDDAITALYELSGGIPRKVDQIAQLALLAGAGRGLEEIDAETLTDAYQELGAGGLQ
jgi:general secretion pathway protein A